MTVGGTKAMRRLPAHGAAALARRRAPRVPAAVAAWRDRPLDGLTDAELLDGVQELLDAGTTYYTAVQAIIPLAASSEVVFTRFYDALVRRPGEPSASTFLVGFDSAPIRAEKSLWDLAEWTRGHAELADGGARRPGRGLGGRRSGARRRVARPVPGAPRPLRARHLQPRLHAPHPGRRPGPAVRGAAVRPRRRRRRPVRAAAGVGGPAGGADRGRRSRGSTRRGG